VKPSNNASNPSILAWIEPVNALTSSSLRFWDKKAGMKTDFIRYDDQYKKYCSNCDTGKIIEKFLLFHELPLILPNHSATLGYPQK